MTVNEALDEVEENEKIILPNSN